MDPIEAAKQEVINAANSVINALQTFESVAGQNVLMVGTVVSLEAKLLLKSLEIEALKSDLETCKEQSNQTRKRLSDLQMTGEAPPHLPENGNVG